MARKKRANIHETWQMHWPFRQWKQDWLINIIVGRGWNDLDTETSKITNPRGFCYLTIKRNRKYQEKTAFVYDGLVSDWLSLIRLPSILMCRWKSIVDRYIYTVCLVWTGLKSWFHQSHVPSFSENSRSAIQNMWKMYRVTSVQITLIIPNLNHLK